MLRRPNFRSLRGRLFVALFFTAAVPTLLLLVGGSFLLREFVVGTGSAGPWNEVAESGQALLERIDDHPDPEVRAAAERHREHLSESLRLSRLYVYLGERVLVLLPAAAGLVFLFAAALALWSARRLSRSLTRPVREIVAWTEAFGRDEPLPPPNPAREAREIREVRAIREGLREMATELSISRARELREAKNRSWAEVARRVAHDLKNPLAPMRMAARTAEASADPGAAEAGRILLSEIERLDELSRSFAHFGQPPEGPPSAVELGELVTHLAGRLEGGGEEGIPELLLRIPESAVFVEGHPVALERVVRNLIANAQDAGLVTTPEAPVEVELSSDEAWARIRVLDRGPGLPPGEEGRIWLPDFTTKRRGTGLGLPIVAQVVNAHGGTVAARNRNGGGAVFEIVLPLRADLHEAVEA